MTEPLPPDPARLRLRHCSIEDLDAITMLAEIQRFYITRYGGGDLTPYTATEFAPPTGGFWIAVHAGEQVGCAGLRRHDQQTAELKRMYVRATHRRQGLARRMLVVLEQKARDLGYRRLILEAGSKQPEAVALYRAHGYQPTENYGYYRDSGSTYSFVTTLWPPRPPRSAPAGPG